MTLSTLLGKNLKLKSSFHNIKGSPLSPTTPPMSQDPHHSATITSFLPLYSTKYTSLHFSSTSCTINVDSAHGSTESISMDVDTSFSTSEYHGDVDLSSIYATRRFFLSPPGRSNSIFDSPSSMLLDEEEAEVVQTLTYSPNSYISNWQSLQELLLHCLSHNPKPNHERIIRASVELLISLVSPCNDCNDNDDVNMLSPYGDVSQRFFFPPPGHSNSIFDTASSMSLEKEEVEGELPLPSCSPDPYTEFRRSMEETVEKYGLNDVVSNWQSLQEVLLRHLSNNPKPTHKFIIRAFADLLVSLMSSPSNANTCPGPSTSIVGSTSSTTLEEEEVAGEVVVETYSPDPYTDFRRSMEEMVEARDPKKGVKIVLKKIKKTWLQYII